MLLRLCQLKSRPFILLFLVSLSSCSLQRNEASVYSKVMTTFSSNWFGVSPKHSLMNIQGGPVPHLFFDTTSEFNAVERTLNVIITTPEDSPHAYSIDLNSGQRHYSHTYCKQSDIWNVYGGGINRPNFSIGHLPRVLDQLGEPQKIIVWSKRANFIVTAGTNYHKVKLLGAYVEQICPEGNCLGKNNWLSRLVFVAVDWEDKSLSALNSIEEFKLTFNWEASKAHLENGDGQNFIGDQSYPAIKVGQLIEYEDAFTYFKKRSIFLTNTELKKIQKGCHGLYDKLVENFSGHHMTQKSASYVVEKKPLLFSEKFKKITKKYYNEISTCEKFVYHGNINHSQEDFWTLSYIGLFYRLHREGYYFDCLTSTWQKNVLNAEGSPIYDIRVGIDQCGNVQLDKAMKYIPNFLLSLRGENEFFRFIDYDNHSFGTHNKMYTWVKSKSRRLDCSNNPNTKIRQEMNLFPEDVEWKPQDIHVLPSEKLKKQ